jgi:hypothetical protein
MLNCPIMVLYFMDLSMQSQLLHAMSPSIIDISGPSYCVELPGREADHSPPSSAEVKNGGDIPPLPPYVFMA